MNESATLEKEDIEKLKTEHLSKPQNRLLADTFYKSGLIESWGRGTLKILNDCLSAGLKAPDYELNQDHFAICFYRNNEEVTDKVTDKVTDNQLLILEVIQKNKRVTTSQLAREVRISQRKVKDNILKLKKIGILDRIGSPKTGYWKIINND